MNICSCSKRLPFFPPELSALDRISAIGQKLACVDALIREVWLRNEVFTMKKPDFLFLKATKTGSWEPEIILLRVIKVHHVPKKQKALELTIETTRWRLRASKELKADTNTNASVVLGVKNLSNAVISDTEMEKYCETIGIKLCIRQTSRTGSQLWSFYCGFKFEKVSSSEFWPENVIVSRFYLDKPARKWLKSIEKRWLEFRISDSYEKRMFSCFLYNARFVKYKTKDLNAFLQINKMDTEICVKLWIRSIRDEKLFFQQCCPFGFKCHSLMARGIVYFMRSHIQLEKIEGELSVFLKTAAQPWKFRYLLFS